MVDGSGLENRRGASPREFESHPLRQRLEQAANRPSSADADLQPRPRRQRRGERRLLLPLVAAFLVVLVGGVWVGFATGRVSFGCAFTPANRCLRVLFLGNSYTSVNDLPVTFARLAAAGGWTAETTMVAPGAATLADHAASSTIAAVLGAGNGQGPWTAVVLQEQSQIPAIATTRDRDMAPAASALAKRILLIGARPYLLQTWAPRDGMPGAGLDYTAMQDAIDESYRALAVRTGSGLVPAGEAWKRALAEAPAIALWADDGSHPSMAGTYLAACSLYLALTGSSPVGLSETAGLDSAVAAALQGIVAGR